jgi:hypothetical protein
VLDAATSVEFIVVEKSAASVLFALKWPARKIRPWELPSSFCRSASAVHGAVGGFDGLISESALPAPSAALKSA